MTSRRSVLGGLAAMVASWDWRFARTLPAQSGRLPGGDASAGSAVNAGRPQMPRAIYVIAWYDAHAAQITRRVIAQEVPGSPQGGGCLMIERWLDEPDPGAWPTLIGLRTDWWLERVLREGEYVVA